MIKALRWETLVCVLTGALLLPLDFTFRKTKGFAVVNVHRHLAVDM